MLCVDDDAQIRSFLQLLLSQADYDVDVAATGAEGVVKVLAGGVDLVLLDIGLPDIDGFEVLSEIRATSPHVAVIMLTARTKEAARVQGLRAGADDYIVKPFSNNELLARMSAVLRRTESSLPDRTFVDGPLTIDRVGRTATLNGEVLPLSATEWLLLLALVDAHGGVVPASRLLELAWHDPSGYNTDKVKFVIKRLRAEFVSRGFSDPIATHRTMGYSWAGLS